MREQEKLETFSVKLPKSEKDKFLEYLKRNSLGEHTAEQFRQFVYKVNEGKLVLKHKALVESHAERLRKTLETSREERSEEDTTWIYNKDCQGLIKIVNGKLPTSMM